jgi:hypothetical protein
MSDGPVHIVIGTDDRQGPAEIALIHSLRKHASLPLSITLHHDPRLADPDGTGFSRVRFALPNIVGDWATARVVYLDADCLVLGDIAELWRLPRPVDGPFRHVAGSTGAVAVVETEAMQVPADHILPTAADNWNKLRVFGYLSPTLPPEWECIDGNGYEPGKTKLIHFSCQTTQPWRPYPERFEYREHPRPEIAALWWEAYKGAMCG